MTARRIELDFARTRRPAAALGWALLAAGGALALFATLRVADALAAQADARGDLATLDDAMQRAHARQPAKRPAEPRFVARYQAGRQVAQALQSPWAELLEAIELMPHDDVALLAVEPSALRHTVHITAEARTERAMLEHLAQLQNDSRLGDVTLVAHQRQTQAPGTPWRYQIQARW